MQNFVTREYDNSITPKEIRQTSRPDEVYFPMVNSKEKGNAYERLTARTLSKWISAGERDDLLWRSTTSGGQFTTYNQKKESKFQSQAGDLAAIDNDHRAVWFTSQFALELKHYGDLQIDNLIFGSPSKLAKFWSTHVKLCEKVQKAPFMVVRQNFRPDLLLLPATHTHLLERLEKPTATVIRPDRNISIYLLSDFLKNVSFEKFRESFTDGNFAI